MRNSLEDPISFGQISVPKVTQRASLWDSGTVVHPQLVRCVFCQRCRVEQNSCHPRGPREMETEGSQDTGIQMTFARLLIFDRKCSHLHEPVMTCEAGLEITSCFVLLCFFSSSFFSFSFSFSFFLFLFFCGFQDKVTLSCPRTHYVSQGCMLGDFSGLHLPSADITRVRF